MSRLLFAAARGARIQYRSPIDRNWKESAFRLWPDLHDCKTADSLYRIHPADEHLQYGPVSTEVRKAAENIAKKAYLHDVLGHYGLAAIDDYLSRSNEFGYCWDKAMNATANQKQLFLLILAEALADEGM
jgi:hypothetical protein